jgi:hypothetical protein
MRQMTDDDKQSGSELFATVQEVGKYCFEFMESIGISLTEEQKQAFVRKVYMNACEAELNGEPVLDLGKIVGRPWET